MFTRTPYNYDRDQASIDSGLHCTDPSRTQQQFTDEVDINAIMHRFGVTGQPPANVRMPQYADFSEAVDDYQTALNMVRAAEDSFMQLPSEIRERFANNPQKLLEFCEDDRNIPEAQRLGLVKKPLDATTPNAENTNAATRSA